jgi:predicted O-linked N-acetylglucosamine transferase (SPINDLY family)
LASYTDGSSGYAPPPGPESDGRRGLQFDVANNETFMQAADRWREVSQWSDDQLVDCIRDDKIDILFDVSGHSAENRLRVFARKSAPIRVTAWGHATGTGLPTIH